MLVSHNVNLVLPSAGFLIQLANGRIQKAASRNVLVRELPPLNAKQLGDDGGNAGADSDVQSSVEPDRHQAQQDLREIYEEEKRELGQVGAKDYLSLLRAAGGALYWVVFALLYGGTQLFSFMESLWLKYWTSDSRPEALRYYLSGYAIIVMSGILFGAFRWVWLYGIRFCGTSVGFCDRAAPRIHASMLGSLIRSPMLFFARTPTGRIINRFSEDLNRLDAFISDDFGRSVTAGKIAGAHHLRIDLTLCYPTALAFAASLLVIAIKAPVRVQAISVRPVWNRSPVTELHFGYCSAHGSLRILAAIVSCLLPPPSSASVTFCLVSASCEPISADWLRQWAVLWRVYAIMQSVSE